jgi:hypothetical protein
MKTIGWWEWKKHKSEKKAQEKNALLRSRAHAEGCIQWELPQQLLPVTERKYSFGSAWYVRGASIGSYFVYVLRNPSGSIRYVGLTDDPPRRHMEHRRNGTLPFPFSMSVVAVGGRETEKEWISRCKEQGCNLLNVQQAVGLSSLRNKILNKFGVNLEVNRKTANSTTYSLG